MKMIELEIQGLKLVEMPIFPDDRGFFSERFNAEKFQKWGLPTNFVQDNFSRSGPGVLRGLHYQYDPAQGKLVTCTRGRIFDVAVDIRKGSPSFGKYFSIELSGEDCQWFWIPHGFAHGFCVLDDEPADVMYKVNDYYNPKGESGLLWNDPELSIQWPIQNPKLSAKDEELGTLKDLPPDLKFS